MSQSSRLHPTGWKTHPWNVSLLGRGTCSHSTMHKVSQIWTLHKRMQSIKPNLWNLLQGASYNGMPALQS